MIIATVKALQLEQALDRRTSAYSPFRRLLRLLSNTLYLQAVERRDVIWIEC